MHSKYPAHVKQIVMEKEYSDEEIAKWLGTTKKHVRNLRYDWIRDKDGRKRNHNNGTPFDLVDTEEL